MSFIFGMFQERMCDVYRDDTGGTLVVGNQNDAVAASRRFALIVNCTPDLPFFEIGDGVSQEQIRIPVLDIQDRRDIDALRDAIVVVVPRIAKHLAEGNDVLVHCVAGRQRSCAVVAAFLMARKGLSREDAIAFVKTKKRDAFFPEANFADALC